MDCWVKIFNYLKNNDCKNIKFAINVEYILCLPGTKSSMERVFAAVNKTWTSEKKRIDVETLKAILTNKSDLKYSCGDFYKYLKSNPE